MAIDTSQAVLLAIGLIAIYLILWRPKKTRLFGAIFVLAYSVGMLYIGTTTQEDFAGFVVLGIGLVSIFREMLEIF